MTGAHGVHERETAFHDAVAATRVPEPLAASPDQWEQAILDAIGDVKGQRVLELGCGDGGLTCRLADLGAQVTAQDISPGMVTLARDRLGRFRPGSDVRVEVGPAEDTGLDPASCDVVVGKWLLHHVDLDAAANEIRRVLRPGGTAVFVETSALNPGLAWARDHIVLRGRLGTKQYGTDDERPLGRSDLRRLRAVFPSLRVDHPNFVLLHMFNRNVLNFPSERLTRRLIRIDNALGRRLPVIRPLSYYMRITIRG